MSEKPDWQIRGNFLVKLSPEGQEAALSAQEFWDGRLDDFTSYIGLTIEGFGRLSLTLDEDSKKLALKITGQNSSMIYLGEFGFPNDHVVIGNSWIPLHHEETLRYKKFIEAENLNLGSDLNFEGFLSLIRAEAEKEIEVSVEGIPELMRNSLDINESSGSLDIKPYAYQQTGINWLCALYDSGVGGILGDEMGLGKTVQMLGLLSHVVRMRNDKRILVIVPASLKLNWKSEFEKFLSQVVPYVHSGPERTRSSLELSKHNVVITTYPVINRDIDFVRNIKWDLVICDEAHNMKNPSSVTRSSIKKLSKAPIFLSTGTPLENNLLDVWSLIDLIRPGLMGPEDQMKQLLSNQFSEAEYVAELVRPLILRRKVKNVLPELPSLVEKIHWIQPSEEFARNYGFIRDKAFASGQSSSKLAVITELRRFCTYPPMVGNYMRNIPDMKVDLLLDILDRIESQKEKAIIFTSWHDSADFIYNVLHRNYRGIFAEVVDGREVSDLRFPKIQQFQAIQGFAVLVCNTRAAGEGLNITAANHVIHYDRQWNPAKEAQATSRSHRMGQASTVFVHKLVYKGTIEEIIDDRLLMKEHLAHRTLKLSEEEEDKKSLADALGIKPNYGESEI